MTTARTVCAGCAAVYQIGALRDYANGPGVVVRCLACGGVRLRVVGAGRYWLDMRGVCCVEIERLSE